MSAETGIAWTDHTFNPWWGCQRVSPGCENCYAETWDRRWGGEHWGAQAERRFFGEKHWAEPLKWNRAAGEAGVRRRVFCASMADVFEDRPELEAERNELWQLISNTQHLDWQLLTKRPQNVVKMLPWGEYGPGPDPWPNVWIGTTVEDQRRADERIEALMRIPAVVRFLSCEPLLEQVDLGPWFNHTREVVIGGRIGWVIVGGESGAGARPMDLTWARHILSECGTAGIPCFVKQLGGARDKRDDPSDWPEDLRVREFPADAWVDAAEPPSVALPEALP